MYNDGIKQWLKISWQKKNFTFLPHPKSLDSRIQGFSNLFKDSNTGRFHHADIIADLEMVIEAGTSVSNTESSTRAEKVKLG
jgi:hypothetical protein